MKLSIVALSFVNAVPHFNQQAVLDGTPRIIGGSDVSTNQACRAGFIFSIL